MKIVTSRTVRFGSRDAYESFVAFGGPWLDRCAPNEMPESVYAHHNADGTVTIRKVWADAFDYLRFDAGCDASRKIRDFVVENRIQWSGDALTPYDGPVDGELIWERKHVQETRTRQVHEEPRGV